MTPSPLITKEMAGTVTVLAVGAQCAQINDPLLDPLSAELLEHVRGAVPPLVVLDLSATEFFGSGFIEVLLRAFRELQKRPGAKMAICGLQTYCREVLEITHLDQLWPLPATRGEAVARFLAE